MNVGAQHSVKVSSKPVSSECVFPQTHLLVEIIKAGLELQIWEGCSFSPPALLKYDRQLKSVSI